MAETVASTSWYMLVFAAIGLAAVTFVAIMSHIPRIPEQRGLLAVILASAFAAVLTLLLTQIPAGNKGLFDFFKAIMVVAILAALLDLFYFIQARRRHLGGAGWSLLVTLGLLACSALGLLSQYA
ncbi:MAG: hypothetical protein ACTHMR_05430 [Thermomicrobiales bacterium]